MFSPEEIIGMAWGLALSLFVVAGLLWRWGDG